MISIWSRRESVPFGPEGAELMKILIVNPFGIGDVIFSTPLIEVLKTRYPRSYIGYVCNRRAHEVIKTNPLLGRIFIYEKDDFRVCWQSSRTECVKKIWRFLNSIRNERFDLSIDLSLGYQYSMFLKLLGVKKRLGFNYRERGVFLTDKIDIDGFHDKHVVEYYLDLARLLGIDTAAYKIKPRVYISESEKARSAGLLKNIDIQDGELVIGMVPGCGASWGIDAKYRRWDRKNFAALADSLISKYNAKVILFGDAKEMDICGDVEGMMKSKVINYSGKTTIGDFIGLLTRCGLVITNDGGPLHMAVGLGVKTVSIFGPVDGAVYGPYPANGVHHIVVAGKKAACRPCYRGFKYAKCEERTCFDSITVEDVLKASEEILSR